VQRAYTDIEQGELVDTYASSAFEDTRRKAARFGAMGSTIRATKPGPAAAAGFTQRRARAAPPGHS
jgi:hypothetical protein